MTIYVYRGSEGMYVYVPVAEFQSAQTFYTNAGYKVEV